MAIPNNTKERVKKAYIESRTPISALAAMFDIDPSTISRWKQADLKHGEDWDKGQAAALLAGDELESTTREALAGLICQIKKTMEDIPGETQANSIVKAQAFASLVDALHKAIHASRRIMPNVNKLATAREAIKHFAQFVALNYPDKTGDLIEVIEAFGSHLPIVFKE